LGLFSLASVSFSNAAATNKSVSTSFSSLLWNLTFSIFQEIEDHPYYSDYFNKSLDLTVFSYFLEQDIHYLPYYAACTEKLH
jgi:thiaminase